VIRSAANFTNQFKFLLDNHKRQKKRREERIGLSSKSNQRGARNQIKKNTIFFPALFLISDYTPIKIV
jgi:hypothetical protein